MSKLTLSVEVSKETHEVATVVKDLLKAVKDKKPLTQVAAEELPALFKAVEGIDQLDDEARADMLASIHAVQLPLTEGIVYLLQPAAPAAPEA